MIEAPQDISIIREELIEG
ncbi:hypothetical protein JQR88_23650 (plasmid) [Pseudomonas luteola]|nr:hypothetical protein FOB45_02975 [Pseudomonas luteola]